MKSSREKLKIVLQGIKSRCYYKPHPSFKNYGKKGIVVCGEWKTNTESFIEWALTNGYESFNRPSVDRIDNSKEYSPENCRIVELSDNIKKMCDNHKAQGTGGFSEESFSKIRQSNKNNLGVKLTLDGYGQKASFICSRDAADFIVKLKNLDTSSDNIKKNLSACLHGKRKRCHGFIVTMPELFNSPTGENDAD